MELNLNRRHLNESKRAVIASNIANMPRHRPNKSANLPTYITQNDASRMLNVSERMIRSVKTIEKHDPDRIDDIMLGKTTVHKVEKEIKNEIYKNNEFEKKDTSNIIVSYSDLYKLYNNDLLLESRIQDNSLDAIITDPPYPYEFIDCWSKLAEFASNKLKEGGVLVTMSGQSYLPEVYSRMNIPGLNYYWTCCIKTTVSPNMHQKRLLTHWKPLLFYVKGEYNKTFLKTDCYFPDYKDTIEGQTFHKWGQSLPLMEKIIEDFTYAGELVCDPFMGGGTTIVAGVNMKRNMIGIEIDEKVYNNTCKRIHYDVSGL